jgi:hypothetical protein
MHFGGMLLVEFGGCWKPNSAQADAACVLCPKQLGFGLGHNLAQPGRS